MIKETNLNATPKDNTTSMAIFIRLFSSILMFGRCSSLYKLPLQVARAYKL